jgi:hypothetical protein
MTGSPCPHTEFVERGGEEALDSTHSVQPNIPRIGRLQLTFLLLRCSSVNQSLFESQTVDPVSTLTGCNSRPHRSAAPTKEMTDGMDGQGPPQVRASILPAFSRFSGRAWMPMSRRCTAAETREAPTSRVDPEAAAPRDRASIPWAVVRISPSPRVASGGLSRQHRPQVRLGPKEMEAGAGPPACTAAEVRDERSWPNIEPCPQAHGPATAIVSGPCPRAGSSAARAARGAPGE